MPQPALADFQQFDGGNGGVPHTFAPPVRGHINKPGRLGFIQGIMVGSAGIVDKRGQIHGHRPEHTVGQRLQPFDAEHGMGA